MKRITIFTPTYNREKYLVRLYESLCKQTCGDFVWLIVDDGSTDGTGLIVQEWVLSGRIEIRYYYQENAGKMSAHNYGARMTDTELFFCVDSDDWLVPEAVEKILACWEKVGGRKEIHGLLAYKGYEDGKSITKLRIPQTECFTLREAGTKYGLTGDTALIFESETLKKHEFPVYEGEKFVPEAYLYDQLDQEGKLFFLPEILYIVKYLKDGYSAEISRHLYQNPKGYFAYINQRLLLDGTWKEKLLDSARYDAMAIAHKRKRMITKSSFPLFAVLAYPLGMLLYWRKYARFVKKDTVL